MDDWLIWSCHARVIYQEFLLSCLSAVRSPALRSFLFFLPLLDILLLVPVTIRWFIYKSLLPAYRSVLSGSSVSTKGPESEDTSSVKDESAVRLPSDGKIRGNGWRGIFLGRDPLQLLGCPLLDRLNINCTYVCMYFWIVVIVDFLSYCIYLS